MKFTSVLIKKAWKIRREAAKKYNCKVMEISWAMCLKMAKEEKENFGNFNIEIINKIGDVDKKRKAKIKEWRSNTGNFTAACHAAWHYVNKEGEPMLVIRHHVCSMLVTKEVFRPIWKDEDLTRYGYIPHDGIIKADAGLVMQNGEVLQVLITQTK